MIAVDTNLLVYAHREDSPWHARAFERLAFLAESSAPWAIPWPCIHEFLAIVTSPRIYNPPTPLDLALDQVDAWFESPGLQLISESSDHWPLTRQLLLDSKARGGMVHDARIAAICLQHGIRELWSADRDFSRFSSLRTINPLVSVLATP
jgi:toxin-antitoxin system PIN domain toxin